MRVTRMATPPMDAMDDMEDNATAAGNPDGAWGTGVGARMSKRVDSGVISGSGGNVQNLIDKLFISIFPFCTTLTNTFKKFPPL